MLIMMYAACIVMVGVVPAAQAYVVSQHYTVACCLTNYSLQKNVLNPLYLILNT